MKVLSERLKKLEKYRMVERRVLDSYPPRIRYVLTERGRRVARWIINEWEGSGLNIIASTV